LRILFTLHHELSQDAGAPGVTFDLARIFSARGHNVEYISFDDLPAVLPERVKMVTFPSYVAWRLAQDTRETAHPTVVDSSTGDSWVWSAFSDRSARRARSVLVCRSHGLEHIAHATRLAEAKRGALDLRKRYFLYHGGLRLREVAASLRRADAAVFLNSRELEYAVTHLGVSRERAHVVPNGLPAGLFEARHGIRPVNGSVRIAQIGSYLRSKGVAYGGVALERVLRRHPHVSVSFLGTRVPREQVLRDFSPAVHRQVRVVREYRRSELPDLLADHHVNFFPTLSEGFSLALLEAMACGLAPVATAVGANTDVVADGVNGLTVPPGDSAALEAAVERLVTDQPFLERLRKAAWKAAERYRWTAVADRLLEIYRGALAEKVR
jgi:glycosyltransferase involved in cell wall biosynthesis